jgi:alanine racemase
MDMITIDVTEVESVAVGDRVELWGGNLPINAVAASAGTIGYELMTGVTRRVPRVYV